MTVLRYSLLMESMTAHFLGSLLNIKDVRNSKSFGETGSALSFYQKINLLIDIGALEGEHFKNFQLFMEVRNKFMHNIEVRTFEDCFTMLEGKDKKLLKDFPQDQKLTKELQLRGAFINLSDNVLQTSARVWKVIEDKISKQVRQASNERALLAYDKSVAKLAQTLNTIMENELKKEDQIPLEKLSNLGVLVGGMLLTYWKESFDELSNSSDSQELPPG